MARRPLPLSRFQSPIDRGAVSSSPDAGAGAIFGRVIGQSGQAIAREGAIAAERQMEIDNDAAKAARNIELGKRVATAKGAFLQAYEERASDPTQFETLADDADAIAKRTVEDATKTLTESFGAEVRGRFDAWYAATRAEVVSDARRQAIDVSLASLDQSIHEYSNIYLMGNADQRADAKAQIRALLDDAVTGDLMSAQRAQEAKRQTLSSLAAADMQRLMGRDPGAALQILGKRGSLPELDPIMRVNLIDRAQRQAQSFTAKALAQEEREERRLEKEIEAQQEVNNFRLQLGLATDTRVAERLTPELLEQLVEERSLSPDDAIKIANMRFIAPATADDHHALSVIEQQRITGVSRDQRVNDLIRLRGEGRITGETFQRQMVVERNLAEGEAKPESAYTQYRELVSNSLRETGPMGQLIPGAEERRTRALIEYDQLIEAGEAPAQVAEEVLARSKQIEQRTNAAMLSSQPRPRYSVPSGLGIDVEASKESVVDAVVRGDITEAEGSAIMLEIGRFAEIQSRIEQAASARRSR